MDLLRKLLSSRKFLVMMATCIGLLITKVFKVQVDQATILEFLGVVAAWLIAQGIADKGKEAAKVDAIAVVQTDSLISSTEKIEAIKSV